ncbi:response regulator [Rubrivivax sp. JA1026]|uniref:response regulator n=1 Tax=Rubrivivax sp. JA1026 TaxID=2710888 RepID=UPI0013E9849E|nr:response regulator [Rubrivivax sp. JA1026]
MTVAPADDVTASLPRVLLVEDDPSIRRFVQIALEELPLHLVEAATLAEARAALSREPVRLVICDLMLPDGNGVDLLHELAATGPARPRLVAFSAGISAERRHELEALGVDEVLSKPVPLDELESCARRALHDPAAPPPVPAPGAVAQFFAGDAVLYEAYRASCLPQFLRDVRQGDAALDAGDLAALRRLAHSLKSVLLTLGYAADAERAAALDRASAAGDAAAARDGWALLRGALLAIVEAG